MTLLLDASSASPFDTADRAILRPIFGKWAGNGKRKRRVEERRSQPARVAADTVAGSSPVGLSD
jgi:hypothetical protein